MTIFNNELEMACKEPINIRSEFFFINLEEEEKVNREEAGSCFASNEYFILYINNNYSVKTHVSRHIFIIEILN